MTSKQHPIKSGFGLQTTAREALDGTDLRGKIAIVTGGYAGLGLETTRVLAEAGATVIVPARTPDKARKALADIPRVQQAALDLLDPTSITAFAQSFVDSGRALDILINCEGIMATPLTRDARGYEAQFSANHLGHFQLTAHLAPALRKAGSARVVALSSRGHQFSGIDFDDPNFTRQQYDKWKAYGQSKTANALFALELDARGASHGIRVFSVHPGRIMDTDLVRHLSIEDLRAAGAVDEQGQLISSAKSKTIAQGAATGIWCATSKQLEGMGGVYCEDSDIAPLVSADSQGDFGVKPWAADPAFAERLWTLSEELTGVRFRFD